MFEIIVLVCIASFNGDQLSPPYCEAFESTQKYEERAACEAEVDALGITIEIEWLKQLKKRLGEGTTAVFTHNGYCQIVKKEKPANIEDTAVTDGGLASDVDDPIGRIPVHLGAAETVQRSIGEPKEPSKVHGEPDYTTNWN